MKKISIYEFKNLISLFNDFELSIGEDYDAAGLYRVLHIKSHFNKIAVILNGAVCLLGSDSQSNFSLNQIHDITMSTKNKEIFFRFFCGNNNLLPVVIRCH